MEAATIAELSVTCEQMMHSFWPRMSAGWPMSKILISPAAALAASMASRAPESTAEASPKNTSAPWAMSSVANSLPFGASEKELAYGTFRSVTSLPSFSPTYFAASSKPAILPFVVSSSIPPMKPSLPDSVIRPASAPAIQPICWAFGKSEETFLLTAFSGVSAAPFRRANAMSGYSSAACRTASVYWLPGA